MFRTRQRSLRSRKSYVFAPCPQLISLKQPSIVTDTIERDRAKIENVVLECEAYVRKWTSEERECSSFQSHAIDVSAEKRGKNVVHISNLQ